MTREEAINDLKDFIDIYLTCHGEKDTVAVSLDNVDVEAFHMAIKALEQEPYEKFESAKDHIYKLAGDYKCWDNRFTHDEALELCHILEQEPCEDCISREQAIKATYGFERYTGIDEAPYEYAESILRELPPVTPTRPKGHWINIDKTHSKCDKCESIFEIVSVNGEANYCPNCGYFMSERGKGRKDKMSEEELERIKK